jgi:hypothetical protein
MGGIRRWMYVRKFLVEVEVSLHVKSNANQIVPKVNIRRGTKHPAFFISHNHL